MLNLPGVNVYLKGNEALSRSYVEDAFRLYQSIQRTNVNIGDTPAIQKYERQIGDSTVLIKMHHGQASITISTPTPGEAAPVTKKREEQPIIVTEVEEAKDTRVFLRLYVHVDVIGLSSISSPGYKPSRGEVANALACGIYDPDTGDMFDVKSTPLSYMVQYPPSLDYQGNPWAGLYDRVGETVTDIISYYESVLPSVYGEGEAAYRLEDLPFFIISKHCANDPVTDFIWTTYTGLYPGYIHAYYWPSAPGDPNPKTTTVAGCCTDVYAETQSGGDIEWGAANNFKKIRPSDGAYGCDLVGLYSDFSGATYNYYAWAYYSFAYGDIYNGLMQIDRKVGSEFFMMTGMVADGSRFAGGLTGIDYTEAPRINAPTQAWGVSSVGSPDVYTGGGFNCSMVTPEGICVYGEIIQMNVIEENGAAYDLNGIININATIGRGLAPFSPNDDLWDLEETTRATAAFKELYEKAVVEAGGYILDPATASSNMASYQNTAFGHAAVDMRTLGGTVYGSALVNVKLYAVPIKVTKERRDG